LLEGSPSEAQIIGKPFIDDELEPGGSKGNAGIFRQQNKDWHLSD
jgi:hypothetical protein